MRAPAFASVLLLAGCATVPHAWQNPETGAFAPAAVIDQCRLEAEREANRNALMWGPVSPSYGLAWGRRRGGPAWGWGGWGAYSSGAIIQRTQELTAFCLRVQGYRLLPVEPAASAPAEPRDGEEKPE
jgi:hypothetical protein